MEQIVVIGAGQAGASLVAKLRSLGFAGGITLVGDEPFLPYQRPPLSKKYLVGQMERERLFLRPESFYHDEKITLKLGARADRIDAEAREVHVGGERLAYDKLAITTGMRARHLPAEIGGALEGVHVIRTLGDVDAMAEPFAAARKVLVVGGGYIGLEAAAVAADKGAEVTLVELGPRILGRVASPETSDFFRELHTGHGVTLLEETGLTRLTGEGRVTGAVLADGREIETDLVIVGIGLLPGCAIAEAAGLAIENGVQTDAYGQTSNPAIWSAGDCANFPYKDGRLRLESVQNAIDMAECVAANMLGASEAYTPHPWFWSDQYDVKLQIAGLNTGYDSLVERAGDHGRSFWYFCGPRLVAVDAMNAARDYMIGKRLIEMGKSPTPEQVADSSTNLKALLR